MPSRTALPPASRTCIAALSVLFSVAIAFAAPKEDIAEGKVVQKVPSKKEIYVMTDSGKNEYYFNESTIVIKSGEPKSYADIPEGGHVRVTANKIGKRLDPINVEILTD